MAITYPRPALQGSPRSKEAMTRRHAAEEVAMDESNRPYVASPANGEEADFAGTYVTNFTKGLLHNNYGVVDNPADYETFVDALNKPDFAFEVPDGKKLKYPFHCEINGQPPEWRNWESPLGGHYFTIEGPDPDRAAMAPAPKLGYSELCAEMAEVYAMALLRDVPFAKLEDPKTVIADSDDKFGSPVTVGDVIAELNKLSWFDPAKAPTSSDGSKVLFDQESRRRYSRVRPYTHSEWVKKPDLAEQLSVKTVFRGSVEGALEGPYLSQFMLIGSASRAGMDKGGAKQTPPGAKFNTNDGLIQFGTQVIDQRIIAQAANIDYMTRYACWLGVQNGADVRMAQDFDDNMRCFIATPRDLATYVHYDELYQAYLNALLLLASYKVDFDEGLPHMAGKHPTRGAFATFGGPHLLSLMPEVASRSLRAVRRQKFQIHRRCRPEVLAQRLTLAANGEASRFGAMAESRLQSMLNELGQTKLLDWINGHNKYQNDHDGSRDVQPAISGNNELETLTQTIESSGKNYLLPMAFPEGSPMHAAYGAGHATVAGASVTILKAFFQLHKPGDWTPLTLADIGIEKTYTALPGQALQHDKSTKTDKLTIIGELNKLAANIAIGRNMAGVHYYTDYFDSLRMGERVALAILEEQMLFYNEKVCLKLESFDGDQIEVSTTGGNTKASVEVTINGSSADYGNWWRRHLPSMPQALV